MGDNTDNPFLCNWSVIDYADGGIVHHPMTSEYMANVMCDLLNKLHDENYKIKSILLKRVDELNDAYNKSAKAGMPTGGIIDELDSFEEICRVMGWIE